MGKFLQDNYTSGEIMNIFDWLKVNLHSLFRKVTNPVFSGIIALKNYDGKDIPRKFITIKNLSPDEYSKEINQTKYRPDEEYLFIKDNTIIHPDIFFLDTYKNHDCDDYAQMWFWYGKENGFLPMKILLYEKENETDTCHMTCVLYKENYFYLCDYEYSPVKFPSIKACVNEIRLKYNRKNELIWAGA